ncbi:hypothetical protein Tcan_16705 [Toxocara canis]|uniref:G-protein coupled receptors family 1 profile domain-containing protein n=1 Tax=Toxocara canis TaxID=6265 RepID=A0A0B2VI90_TOXCA|nr:hypothetical protein Tcan_16705 [Toxocara canis]
MSTAVFNTECFANLSSNDLNKLVEEKWMRRSELTYYIYFGWLPLPMAITALVFAIAYMVIVCHAVKRRHVSMKCYVLLLNRTIGDILCCISALVTSSYVLSVDHISESIVGVSETFFSGSCWSAVVSYVSLSVIQFYSVWKPLRFRSVFTMRRCIHLIVTSWIIFAVTVAYALVVLALVKVPILSNWSGCKVETCFRIMLHSKYVIVLIIYSFTIIIFAITVVLIKRARKRGSSFMLKAPSDSDIRARFPLWKLALNVGTFATLSFPYILWCIVLLLNRDKCFALWNFIELMQLLGIIRFILLFRIFIDPVMSFIIDRQIRRGLLSWFYLLDNGRVTPRRGHSRTSATVTGDGSALSDCSMSSNIVKTISSTVEDGFSTKKRLSD